MILDAQNDFSINQVITTTANGTNDIDLGPIYSTNTNRDIGASDDLYLFLAATTAFAAAGAGTLTVSLITDTTSAFGASTTLYTSPALSIATLNGRDLPIKVALSRGVQKYLRIVYTVGTGPFTAGAVTAGLATELQDLGTFQAAYQFPTGA